MWIPRDIENLLNKDSGAIIQIVLGPRQCGKSSLLSYLGKGGYREVTLDDFQQRNLANCDPALFFLQNTPPLIIDEIQYAPALFPELKKWVDQLKKRRLFNQDAIPRHAVRLTGSNQILMDKNVRETLAGRAAYYYLNTLSVNEILRAFPDINIPTILFQGGWPELYINKELSITRYINDYIRTYLEKDIIQSAGITKHNEFLTVLGMLAARTGQLINCSAIAQDSGVKSVTVREWISVLERADIVYLLKPFHTNLNKRLTKSAKLYFWDTGLAARLQGWTSIEPLLLSSQAGHLFETLVAAEIIKFINNYQKSWKLSLWRTKEGEEVDFIIENERNQIVCLDAKLGIQSVQAEKIPKSLLSILPAGSELVLVSIGGEKTYLQKNCLQLPISQLHSYLSAF